MVIMELLQTAVTNVLVGFLAISNAIAGTMYSQDNAVVTNTGDVGPEEVIVEEGAKLALLPKIESEYDYGGTIPSVLLDSSDYQAAAVATLNDGKDTVKDDSDTDLSESLVNIFCQYKTENSLRTTTGTGFIIDETGVVLTNAHVAQFLLLKEANVVDDANCILRSGSPAEPLYEAELLYISPAWINENASLISAETPAGTGERDYALLYITKGIGDNILPERFPAIIANTELLQNNISGNTIYAGGYPAESLQTEGPEAKLIPVIASTTIGELYTFGSNYADLISIHESAVGEQGSSGGPILNEDWEAIGLIVTKGSVDLDGPMSLRGITVSYIDRTMIEETGHSLIENIQGHLGERGEIFKDIMTPFLSGILSKELEI